MSTNFYVKTVYKQVGDEDSIDTYHIGKRSGGWAFGFNGRDYTTVEAWRHRLNLPINSYIENEYGDRVTVDEFWKMVDGLKGGSTIRPDREYVRNWIDEGCSFSNYEFC